MNLSLKSSLQFFHTSSICNKISSQARIITKIMGGTNKKKAFRLLKGDQPFNSNGIEGLIGRVPGANTKVSNRRVAVMNSLFLEKITEIMSSSDINTELLQFGFLITKVKYATDGTALHVYWTADSSLSLITDKLPGIGGRLRHDLSEIQNTKVPHINFIHDKSLFKATDVEELLKKADYGPDYIRSPSGLLEESTVNETPQYEKPVLCSNILGINRDAIINQVRKSMRHVSEPRTPRMDSSDVQRRVDFKNYLKSQEILRAKMERSLSRKAQQQNQLLDYDQEKEDDYQEGVFLREQEQDYFHDDDIVDPSQPKR